jgi:hypothetical protein
MPASLPVDLLDHVGSTFLCSIDGFINAIYSLFNKQRKGRR